MRKLGPDSVISVVAPFYNEVKNIKTFVEELENEFEKIGFADQTRDDSSSMTVALTAAIGNLNE